MPSISIKSLKTSEIYELVHRECIKATPNHIAEVYLICNEPLVLKARGAHTTYDMARDLMNDEVSYYILKASKIVGAIRVYSPAPESEVGYFMSAEHPGVMTTAIAELCVELRDLGYVKLFMNIPDENVRSLNVAANNGFEGEPHSQTYELWLC